MTDRERLFTFLLPRAGVCETQALYYRTTDALTVTDGTLPLPRGCEVSFDCYFNLFDYALFRDETPIPSVRYVLSLRGDVTLSLRLLRATEDRKGYESVTLREERFSFSERADASFSVPLGDLPGRGSLYVAIRAEGDACYYGGHIDSECAPVRDVRVGIAITTFKRESFVKQNVATLVGELPADRFSVFVTDNGNTLTPEEVPGATLIPNRNLGGSSGFARGMMEILRRGGFTHILLSDDDISFESEVFLRTAAILSYLTDADHAIIGASMLFSDDPSFQNELGAVWTGHQQVPNNKYSDLSELLSLARNADHPSADYSGWWYNCIPVSLPERIGLPFPFFIKIDDAEYCIRSHAKILLLNGIGVWHECFNYKFQSSLEYYHTRNGLILNALHYPRRGALHAFVTLLRDAAKQMVTQRYRTLELVFRAFDDFLQGSDAYRATDAEALHRELAGLGEKQLPREELEKQGYDLSHPLSCSKREKHSLSIKQILTLNGYLLPAEKRTRVVDQTANRPILFYRAKTVVQYNPITEKGFVTRQKRSVLLRTGFRMIGYFFKLLFRHRKAKNSFRRAFPEMISEASWRERLGLN